MQGVIDPRTSGSESLLGIFEFFAPLAHDLFVLGEHPLALLNLSRIRTVGGYSRYQRGLRSR